MSQPKDPIAELAKLRKLAKLSQEIVFDGQTGAALLVVREVNGIHLVEPIVSAIPVGNLFIFLASVTLNRPQVFLEPGLFRVSPLDRVQ